MKRYIANIITGCRILFSLFLLPFPAFSPEFYIGYIICGLSDMLDGTVARFTGSISEFGSKFDTVADLLFFAAVLIKLMPEINLPIWLYGWVAAIAMIKAVNVISGYVRKRRFVAVHSVLNKAAGMLLFILPLTMGLVELQYSIRPVCFVATIAAIQEGYYVLKDREVL